MDLMRNQSDFGELVHSCGMPQSWYQLLFPVPAYCFLRHYVKIPVFQFDQNSLAYWLALVEPLIMQRVTFSTAQSDRNHSLSLSITMKANTTLFDIVIVVSFCCQFTALREVGTELLSEIFEQRGFFPRDYSAFSRFVVRLLSFLIEAEVMPGVFGYHPTIHEGLTIPFKFGQFFKQVSSVSFSSFQQTIRTLLDHQHSSWFCLNLCIFVQVDDMTFVPLVLELLHSLVEIFNRVAFFHGLSDNLHAFVILGLIAESYCK